MRKANSLFLGAAVLFLIADSMPSHAASDRTFDIEIPPGKNFAVAAFRWWQPPETRKLNGVLVLVPGSNADGRNDVGDKFWQEFAKRHRLALAGCFFKDHPHENMHIEDYARAGEGSGQALIDAVGLLAKSAGHPEAETAKLFLWGHSAGGEFNYEFACWKPERVRAFVVNKGGYYFTAVAPEATRAVPGIFFIGGRDEPFRIEAIRKIYETNREAGAAWRFAVEPDAGHELGNTRKFAAKFFDEVISARIVSTQ